jgi:hypothetical protein
MEVSFHFTRDDWVLINMHIYKNWLYSLKPLSGGEYGLCWFFLLFSLVGGIGCLVFLGMSIWLNLGWYYVVGSALLPIFFSGMALEVLNPRRAPVRGLFHELTFRLHLDNRLLEAVKKRRDRSFRRLEENGKLNLGHQYLLRIDPVGYTSVTEFPSPGGPPTRQEIRRAWSEVTAIDRTEHLVGFKVGDAGYDFLPRTAFRDEETYQRFARTAEAYRETYLDTEHKGAR